MEAANASLSAKKKQKLIGAFRKQKQIQKINKMSNNAQLIKRYHTLVRKAGIDENTKLQMLSRYQGAGSSRDLTDDELRDLCGKLDSISMQANASMDCWRKRVLAAICNYFRIMGINYSDDERINKAKGMACKATRSDSFNEITRSQLITLYNAQVKANNDIQGLYKGMEDVLK